MEECALAPLLAPVVVLLRLLGQFALKNEAVASVETLTETKSVTLQKMLMLCSQT